MSNTKRNSKNFPRRKKKGLPKRTKVNLPSYFISTSDNRERITEKCSQETKKKIILSLDSNNQIDYQFSLRKNEDIVTHAMIYKPYHPGISG